MRPLVNPPFETLKPYVPGKPISETERELGITGVVKLASNENPLGPSPMAVEAIQEVLRNCSDYPDGGAFYLKQHLAKFLSVTTEQLIIGNGTNELIEILLRTCVGAGENMIYNTGSFIIYKLCAMAAGVPVKEVPLKNMGFDLSAMAAAVDENTKLLFIANPNNPTGTYVGRQEFEAFLETVPEHVIVVLDEAYFEYVIAEDYPNGLDYISLRKRFIVMRTFSKCYGLAGLRVGYGVGDAVLIDYLNRGRQPFNCNSLGQVAALAALDDTRHVERSVAMNREQMEKLVPQLRQRGLMVTDSQANFVLVDFNRDADVMFDLILRQGVTVRPMGGYGFPTSARITIGTAAQNERLVQALDTVLATL